VGRKAPAGNKPSRKTERTTGRLGCKGPCKPKATKTPVHYCAGGKRLFPPREKKKGKGQEEQEEPDAAGVRKR